MSLIRYRNEAGQKVVLKAIQGHWRLQNEAEILKRFQQSTPFIRPLVDEIQDPQDPRTICLAHLDSDLRIESKSQKLNRSEIKYVARLILEVLKVLHEENFVHTGQRP